MVVFFEMSKKPRYKQLSPSEFAKKTASSKEMLTDCKLCPHCCGVDRRTQQFGFCGAGDLVQVAGHGPHFGEEDVLAGTNGSGTIFFSFCNLRCRFCQNYTISHGNEGDEISVSELASIMVELEESGCHNINLVSPTHYIPQIVEAIQIASQRGLHIPIVYNTGGYDSVQTLRLLEGIIDIYMPDTKYMDEEKGLRYSGTRNYPAVLKAALREMHRQVGDLVIENGLARQGLLVRHLVMPKDIADSERLLEFIAEEISEKTFINIMGQYYPIEEVRHDPDLAGTVSSQEILRLLKYARKLRLSRCITA